MLRQGLQRWLAAAPMATSSSGRQAVRALAQTEVAASHLWQRHFSAEADDDEEKRDPFSNERVVRLAEEIVKVCL